ncbi:MAG TPA: hypothetical protein PK504_10130 [Ferruginibacter sp.]|nr:hypothetical protein [Ferruginibacter sp.]HRE63516.1 hypothetical protein [Ferruginibacter sp.]
MKILALILICQTLFFAACKKANSPNNTQPIFLRDKSLSEIKKEVVGNWKIHYRYGGITGNFKTPMTNSFFRVIQNDSIYLTLNNSLFAADMATFLRENTSFGYSAYTMNFSSIGGTPYSWIVDYKLGDSLILNDNFPNGHAYIMTKLP